MNDEKELLKKFKSDKATWEDYSDFLKLEAFKLEPFFKLAKDKTSQYFGNILKIYIPDKKFPAISITGTECALHCEHCSEKYLGGMKPILNETDLEAFLLNHANSDGVGVLISGGCEPDGSVPLLRFLDTVKKVKNPKI